VQQELTTLLLRAKTGSDEAFSAFVRKLEGRIYRGALALTANAHDARDLTQETFIRAYLGLGRFRQESSPSTWLYGILMNAFREWLRQNRRLGTVSINAPSISDGGSQRSQVEPQSHDLPSGETRQTVTLIYRAISHLPRKQRMAIVMRCLEQMSYGQIAEAMRCSVGTVKSQIHDARVRLDKELTAHGIVSRWNTRPDEAKA